MFRITFAIRHYAGTASPTRAAAKRLLATTIRGVAKYCGAWSTRTAEELTLKESAVPTTTITHKSGLWVLHCAWKLDVSTSAIDWHRRRA